MSSNFLFKGINIGKFGGYSFTQILQTNLKFWLDWALAHEGAYTVNLFDSQSAFSNQESILQPVTDNRFDSCQTWQGIGKEWVWESGIQPPSGATTPFRVSGVYVNGTFYPKNSAGVFSHHVDYLNGRIIFDNPQSIDDQISADYVHRKVFVDFADSIHFRQLLINSVEEFTSDTIPSGTPSRENQLWTPSIFIDLDSGSQTGLQLGGGQIKTRNVIFHIFADNPGDCNLLMDWLDFQSRKVIFIADLNKITFPFDQYGDVIDSATNWIDLINNNKWKKIRVVDGTVTRLNSLNSNIFRARVEWQIEVDFGGI